ncbi:MAG: nucleotide-binding protein, partial [Candidatus Eisenbacteria sp.]|nr:nucleotide-binding protein [Candidatus Eisenbacteria bacterium]
MRLQGGTYWRKSTSSLPMLWPVQAPRNRRVFIGHGRSRVWTDLRDFLRDWLGLEPEEFNRESPAGRSTQERLMEMLDSCDFAFIVLTAEDQHADGTSHPRLNCAHELGLFQGRLGQRLAIPLVEDGC